MRGAFADGPRTLAVTGPADASVYVLRWHDEACAWRTLLVPHAQTPAPSLARLVPGAPLRFEITAHSATLDTLSMRFAAPVPSSVECRIERAEGSVLRRQTTAVPAGPTREIDVLDLTQINFTPGAKYHVLVETPQGLEVEVIRHAGWPSFEIKRVIEGFASDRLFAPRETGPDAAPSMAFLFDPDSAETAMAIQLVRAAAPDAAIALIPWGAREKMWPALKDKDIILIGRTPHLSASEFDALCFALHRRGVCTIFVEASPLADAIGAADELRQRVEAMRTERRRCHFALSPARGLIDALREAPVAPADPAQPTLSATNAAALLRVDAAKRAPHVAIVSVLYRKADVIETFLEHVAAQTYGGQISVVLVDDCSPEDDGERARAFAAKLQEQAVANREVRVLRNEENSGNCASRLSGLAAVEADLYVVMDCDCLINRDFVAAHVFEHWFDDVDVVIGPLNIESNDRDPAALVKELSADPGKLAAESDLQDPVQRDGFLNCITRNFSVKRRRVIAEDLFDLDFSYSATPDTGFGWEDVEMGYRLYAKGAVIRFTEKAFAVHCTHASSASEQVKASGSMRNFLRLFQKHPDLALAGRRWACDTYGKIVDWADRVGVAPSETRTALDAIFAAPRAHFAPLTQSYRPGQRRLRILSYRWHAPHQYELYKLPHDFTLVTGLGNPMAESWSYDQRPLRENVRFLPVGAIDPRQYDLAVLHFDENVLSPQFCNGIIPPFWGDCFTWLLAQNLPKVAICHGTPQFEGQYGLDPARKSHFVVYEDERLKLVEALKDVAVVCNSHQALGEWRFKQGRVIWHGFDPQEFPMGAHDLGVLATSADFYRPHYRGAWEHLRVEELLDPRIKIATARHAGAPIEMRCGNAFATRNLRAYADRIGRFRVYLNTTLRSPMPRARGEAMMTGVVPVCLRNHDVDRFIEHGVDGFYADTTEELAEFVNSVFRDDAMAARMALAARRKAMDVFNHDRYLLAWTRFLSEVGR